MPFMEKEKKKRDGSDEMTAALGVEKKGERKRRTVLEWRERDTSGGANWMEMDNIIYTFSWFEPFDTLNDLKD
uniref:Uncharacterized protein n=1 Tax=Pristionchus pacificus TaxID=54126 RepID=A0A2A6BDN8_PRIPA|eukprot:PDM64015.1 hypothetical protein PRIPAC_54259 [Pristionchus pacificus]